jgi:phage minor structural protein
MSRTFLNVYNRSNMQKTAILENAWQITETKELNQIYHLEFSIPGNDPKAKYLQPFHFVRYGETGQLYRIIKLKNTETDASTIKVDCEHVITTLCDTMIFGAVAYGGRGVKTADTINYLLGKQNTALWELGGCAFTRYFEYGWEQENLLNALYSIPKEFTAAYYWDFDTSGNPYTGQKWKIYLRAIDETINPEYYIRAKQNLLQQGTDQDNTQVCTKLYPLGYGEGVNQLGIKGTRIGSDGSPTQDGTGTPYKYDYLLAPKATRDKYGIIEKVLVDRRFENQASLYSYAQTILSELSTPAYSRSFSVSDLYPLTNNKIDDAEVGKICRMTVDGTTAYITKTVRVLDDPGNLQIDLSTSATDVVSSIADLADRVRIESVYAQGATQLYQHSKDANATKDHGLIMSLYFPSEMKQINKVLLHLKIGPFRAYSKATNSSEQTVGTTASSESKVTATASTKKSTQTSSSGGGSAATNASTGSAGVSGSVTSGATWSGDSSLVTTGVEGKIVGGGSTDSAEGSGSHTHGLPTWSFTVGPFMFGKSQLAHSHGVTLPSGFGSHSHTVSFSGHSHTVTIPAHKHSVTIPAHKHEVTLPAHSHEITPGIFEFGSPKSFTIYVNGVNRGTVKSTSYDKDITAWLLDKEQQIPRDTWIDVDIRPDSNAYVQSSVFIQGFVQSRGGGNY